MYQFYLHMGTTCPRSKGDTLEDLDIQSVDIKTAYLYGDLDEEIYMEQLEGFKLPGKENKVW